MTGFIKINDGTIGPPIERRLLRMADALRHRGPDDLGVWVDKSKGFALGHRRLAIVDLSPAGHQPMLSKSGRFVMAFNGEIYNHLQIRTELSSLAISGNDNRVVQNDAWCGYSDTETLLAGIEAWGIEATLTRCVGMFAIALWDRFQNRLILARDRFGEKPLYFGWVGDNEERGFAFGSELKAIRAFSNLPPRVCRNAAAQYMRFMSVPSPYSIYHGIYKLEPGCILDVNGKVPVDPPCEVLRSGMKHGGIEIRRWWSFRDLVQESKSRLILDEKTALSEIDTCLRSAVGTQSIADVPLGAFLSGGIDSSLIVAMMQAQSSQPIKTFTIAFEESQYDESAAAQNVSKHLGTEHHNIFLTHRDAQNIIPHMGEIYDEPFADASQIPTFLVCKSARQHVTVALSGDGGDEVFGGYNRYVWGPILWRKIALVPTPIRQSIAKIIGRMPVDVLNLFGKPLKSIDNFGAKILKLADRCRDAKCIDEFYGEIISVWNVGTEIVIDSEYYNNCNLFVDKINFLNDSLLVDNCQQRMMLYDTLSYLEDVILCKVDRAAMACSLETRVPFLDHRVVELAWRLPIDMKIRGGISKRVLRQMLNKYVPAHLIERPKAGFSVPIGNWLQGPLRDWAESLLTEQRISRDQIFNYKILKRIWEEHKSGQRDHAEKIWCVLMFNTWMDSNL